jgi:tetratricopeptide (TPR) repeat protein
MKVLFPAIQDYNDDENIHIIATMYGVAELSLEGVESFDERFSVEDVFSVFRAWKEQNNIQDNSWKWPNQLFWRPHVIGFNDGNISSPIRPDPPPALTLSNNYIRPDWHGPSAGLAGFLFVVLQHHSVAKKFAAKVDEIWATGALSSYNIPLGGRRLVEPELKSIEYIDKKFLGFLQAGSPQQRKNGIFLAPINNQISLDKIRANKKLVDLFEERDFSANMPYSEIPAHKPLLLWIPENQVFNLAFWLQGRYRRRKYKLFPYLSLIISLVIFFVIGGMVINSFLPKGLDHRFGQGEKNISQTSDKTSKVETSDSEGGRNYDQGLPKFKFPNDRIGLLFTVIDGDDENIFQKKIISRLNTTFVSVNLQNFVEIRNTAQKIEDVVTGDFRAQKMIRQAQAELVLWGEQLDNAYYLRATINQDLKLLFNISFPPVFKGQNIDQFVSEFTGLIQVILGAWYYQHQQYHEAERWFGITKKLTLSVISSVDRDRYLGLTYYRLYIESQPRNKDYCRRAEQIFKQILDSSPPLPWLILNDLGILYMEAGDHNTARNYFIDALAANSRSGIVKGNFGLLYLKENQLEDAERELTQAFEIIPDNAEICRNLAYSKQLGGKFSEAITQYELCLNIEDKVQLYINIGSVYHRRQLYGAAIVNYEIAINLDPSIPDGYYNLACVYSLLVKECPSFLDDSLYWLEQAFMHKFNDYGLLMKDEDFANICNIPQFNYLLLKYLPPR